MHGIYFVILFAVVIILDSNFQFTKSSVIMMTGDFFVLINFVYIF